MSDLRTAAQQVLEAWDTRAGIDTASRAFEDLRAALAQQAKPGEDLIPPESLFVCDQMGAHVTRVRLAQQEEPQTLVEDGYPTEYALELVEKWHWGDVKGWFDFIKSVWWMPDWGWHEHDAEDEFFAGRNVYRINISTAGWSGNESLIHAMQKNHILWSITWVQSSRGGHYIFEFDSKTPEST